MLGTHVCDLLAAAPSFSLWSHNLSLPTTFCMGESGPNLNAFLVENSSAVCLPLAPLGNLRNKTVRNNESNQERFGVI